MATAEHVSGDIRQKELADLVPGLELILTRALGPGDDTRDAVQEVLARTVSALAADRPIHGPLGGFVYGIAMHVVADIRRADSRKPSAISIDDWVPARDPSPLEALIDREDALRMREALEELAPDERDLLHRCFVNGERVSDIAADLREPAARLRKRKSRALARLRELLAAASGGHELANSPTGET